MKSRLSKSRITSYNVCYTKLLRPKQPAVLPEDRYVTMTDRIQQPMVLIGWPTSYQGADDQTSLDVLASVLGGGTNSYLYQNLVKTQKAVS